MRRRPVLQGPTEVAAHLELGAAVPGPAEPQVPALQPALEDSVPASSSLDDRFHPPLQGGRHDSLAAELMRGVPSLSPQGNSPHRQRIHACAATWYTAGGSPMVGSTTRRAGWDDLVVRWGSWVSRSWR